MPGGKRWRAFIARFFYCSTPPRFFQLPAPTLPPPHTPPRGRTPSIPICQTSPRPSPDGRIGEILSIEPFCFHRVGSGGTGRGVLPVRTAVPQHRSPKPFCIHRVGSGGKLILTIQMPPQRVGQDVFADAIEGFLSTDDVFVIIVLPDRRAGCATIFIDAFRGGGFE
jgi:hypothetical protein